jgi:hypothetical protein
MLTRHLVPLLLLLVCRTGHCQNTNNGVIINNNLIVEPVYIPVAPLNPGPSPFDLLMEKEKRRMDMADIERRLKDAQTRALYDDFTLPIMVASEDDIYRSKPTYITTQLVNVRIHGGANYPVIKQLPKGTIVKVVEGGDDFADGGWWEVFVPGKKGTGYVYGKNLKAKF